MENTQELTVKNVKNCINEITYSMKLIAEKYDLQLKFGGIHYFDNEIKINKIILHKIKNIGIPVKKRIFSITENQFLNSRAKYYNVKWEGTNFTDNVWKQTQANGNARIIIITDFVKARRKYPLTISTFKESDINNDNITVQKFKVSYSYFNINNKVSIKLDSLLLGKKLNLI